MAVEHLTEPDQPVKMEGSKLAIEEGGGYELADYEVSKMGEGLMVENL